MAYKSRTWECPDCEGQFTTVMDDREGPPKFCQLCGNDMGSEPEPILNFSRIGKAQHKTLDKVYRNMETSSAARAQEAADMQGCSVADMSMIKVTNMKDNLREGDTSFIAPSPSPVQTYSPPPSNIRPMDGSAGLATAQMIKTQQGGSIGHQVMGGLKQNHNMRASQMQRAGQMGAFSGKG